MKIKDWAQLFSMSAGVILLAKDEEVRAFVKDSFQKAKEKLSHAGESGDEEGEEEWLDRIAAKAAEARVALEESLEKIAVKAYKKMHIAHTREIEELTLQVDQLKKQVGLAEARIAHLETSAKT